MDASSAHQPPPATPAAPPAPGSNDGTTATSPADESAKRKRISTRQPRNSACQACASLKMKCVPSQLHGVCERCHRMNRECVAAIPKPRKRRTESAVGLDSPSGAPVSGIFGSNTSISRDPNAFTSTPMSLPPISIATDRRPSLDLLMSRPDIRHNGSQSFTTLLTKGLKFDSPYIVQGQLLHGLDYNTTQNSLTVFKQMSTYFPFAHINPAEDAVLLAAQRPFTTLAICAVTSGANKSVQARLYYAVRLALSTKLIIGGESSLDLLVGLMIFMAWHHHYMENEAIYEYACLLVAMAEKLRFSRMRTPHVSASMERDRAFLGCYYICSLISMKAFSRKNPFRWTDDLHQCADNVARMGSLPSDSTLLAVIEVAQTLEDLNQETDRDIPLRSPAYTALVEANSTLASNRLKSLKHQHPSLSTNFVLAAGMIDVHMRRLSTGGNNASALIRCACEMSEYIDDLLNRPAAAMHLISIVDWTNLLYILMQMAKVSKSLPSTGGGWEAGAVSSMLSPESILDRISAHIANATANDPLVPRNEELIRWFQSYCNSIKRTMIQGQRNPPSDARFSSINPGSRSAADLHLPYAEPSAGPIGPPSTGVLDVDFLKSFMDQS